MAIFKKLNVINDAEDEALEVMAAAGPGSDEYRNASQAFKALSDAELKDRELYLKERELSFREELEDKKIKSQNLGSILDFGKGVLTLGGVFSLSWLAEKSKSEGHIIDSTSFFKWATDLLKHN